MAIVIDALAEAAISNLFESVTSLLKDKVNLIRYAKVELEKLQEKLERLQKKIKAVEQKPFLSNERNIDLEAKLKDVLYDSQDFIERYQTTIALWERDKHSITSSNKVSKPWITLCSCFKEHVSASYQLGNEIKKINQKLNEIEQRKEMVDLLNATPKVKSEDPIDGEHDNPRETTHLISTAQPPMGRADDKEKVKELLFDGFTKGSALGKDGVSIVSIVGQGGIGKTTLAKMVFNEVKEQFGNRWWWVCVSEKPNRMSLLKKILKEVCKESEELKGNTSLSGLCTQLQSELSKSKFILVLDDVWELDEWWGDVEGILLGGAMESKILITSRNAEVCQGIGARMHKLPKLSLDESWSLFLRVAKKQEHELVTHNLKGIGEKIVAKCGGLPLVVQTVGSLMRTKTMTKDDWESIEKSEIWKWKMPASSSSSEISGSILPGLILSYDDLPHYLKSCFVYCCIYPKDYEIKRDTLVMQWMAHGLIDQDKGTDVEVTANRWINDLINRSMIEETEYKKLKLHDILHDLALYIGGKECSHAYATKHTRHLSLFGVDDAEVHKRNASGAVNKLRTLLGDSDSNSDSKSDLPLVYIKHLSTNFKWLRVLSLRGCQMDELPKSIEELSLLKYLDVSGSNVRRLPSSVGRLYNLQTLDLSDSNIEELPKEMGELCNLRYLGLYKTRSLKFVAEGLGKLTNLRTLHSFMVCDDKGKTRGCNINELKDLKKLKGKLSIEGLRGGRVKVRDAKKVFLKNRHELNKVEFHFTGQEDDRADNASEERGLLEALEPPHGIDSLEIDGYKGDRPAWCLDSNYGKLRTLWLFCCPSWAAAIGIKSLEELKVRECPTLGALLSMPLLKSLDICECDGLKTIGDLPALESLEIRDCDGLNTIGDLPALESLGISECDGLITIGDMPAVKTLWLFDLPNWESTFTSMPCLRELSVLNCPSARLGWKLLEQLPNLIWLELDSESAVLVPWRLPSQVSTFLPSLKTLNLIDKSNVDELKWGWGRVPEWVWGLSQLEQLYLHSFIEEISLGGRWQCLPKLRELWLSDFPNLKSVVEVNNNITPQEQESETTCPTDGQQQQIDCLSDLQLLWIRSCPALHLPQQLKDHLGKRLHEHW